MSDPMERPLIPTVYLTPTDEIQPPSYEESESAYQRALFAGPLNASPNAGRPLLTLVSLKEEELKRLCYKYIEDDCCYGSRFIQEMILTQIWNDCAFLYIVESLTEKRESCLSNTPYNGPMEDGPEDDSQQAPDLWSVPVNAPNVFADSSTSMEIPYSAYIGTCDNCNGRREFTCFKCNSRGKEVCWRCLGVAYDSDGYSCPTCNRTGEVLCSHCNGTKRRKCTICSGYGRLRYCTKMTVKWKCNKRDHISNASKMPTDLLRHVSGKEIFRERGETVEPVNFPNNIALSGASARLISSLSSPVNARILIQRHSVIAIPYTRATYIWRRKKGQFYVYGFQQEVYFKEYPQQCCCCICC